MNLNITTAAVMPSHTIPGVFIQFYPPKSAVQLVLSESMIWMLPRSLIYLIKYTVPVSEFKKNCLLFHLIIPSSVIFCGCKYFTHMQIEYAHTGGTHCDAFGGKFNKLIRVELNIASILHVTLKGEFLAV